MAKTITQPTILASSTNTAGSTTDSAVIDCTAQDGGNVTLRITNGGTGPTVQAVGQIMVAHKAGSAPTAGSEGTTWKKIAEFGGGVVASDISRYFWRFGPEIAYFFVRFTGNTGQSVTVEATGDLYVY